MAFEQPGPEVNGQIAQKPRLSICSGVYMISDILYSAFFYF